MFKLIYFIGFVLVTLKLLASYGVVAITTPISWWLIVGVFLTPIVIQIILVVWVAIWAIRKS